MSTAEINFICNRKLKIKNSAKTGLFVFCLLMGLVFPWFNSTLWEKVLFGCLLWIDLFIVMLYATQERMKIQRQQDGFYGWQMYFFSWLLLYCAYRIVFEHFHWLLLLLIGYGIIQSFLWASGVVYNIHKDAYRSGIKWTASINIFTVINIIIGVVVLVLSCFIICQLGYGGIAWATGCFVVLHYLTLVSVTFIVQWIIMIKNKIVDSSQIDGAEQNDEQ